MKFVRFSGKSGSSAYVEYLAFENDIPDNQITNLCNDFAIDNAIKHFKDKEYCQTAINTALDNASWTYISEEEFNKIINEE